MIIRMLFGVATGWVVGAYGLLLIIAPLLAGNETEGGVLAPITLIFGAILGLIVVLLLQIKEERGRYKQSLAFVRRFLGLSTIQSAVNGKLIDDGAWCRRLEEVLIQTRKTRTLPEYKEARNALADCLGTFSYDHALATAFSGEFGLILRSGWQEYAPSGEEPVT
jgi:hypothetical protein